MTQEYKKCVKCGISAVRDSTTTFYLFPRAEKDCNYDRVRAWAEFCFPRENLTEKKLKQLHDRHKLLCSKHFDRSAYIDDSMTRLNSNAVPTLLGVKFENTHNDEDLISVPVEIDDLEEKDALYIPDGHKIKQEPNANIQLLPTIQLVPSIEDALDTKGELNTEDSADTEDSSDAEETPNAEDEPNADDTQDILADFYKFLSYGKELMEDSLKLKCEQTTHDSDVEVTMRDIKACRACLHTKGTLVRINDTYRRIFESTCGVVVSPNDGYPYYFCVECMAHIKRILAFRDKSRRADFALKKIMLQQKQVSFTEVAKINRKSTNLESSLEIWKPQNIYFYTYDKTTELADNHFLKEAVKYINGTIRIACSERYLVDRSEDTKEEVDDGIEDTAMKESVIEGTDSISNDTEMKAEDVDLNDVFKGLEEDLDSVDEIQELEQKKDLIEKEASKATLKRIREEKQTSKEEKEKNKVNTIPCRAMAFKLINFKIELLSVEEQMKRHEEQWTSEPFMSSLHKCMICVKVFNNAQLLLEHSEEHNQSRGKPCDICKLCVDEEYMSVHLSERHRYKYSCILCGDEIYDFNTAIQHNCKRTANMEFDDQLDEMFLLVPQSTEEMRAALVRTTGAMKCPVCKLSFTQNAVYKSHVDKHTKRATSKSQCDICGVYHSSVNALTRHMAHWHQYLYQCKVCSFEAPHRYIAVEHLEGHKASSVGCPLCKKKSKSQSGMRFHIRKYHYKETYNKICPLCGLAFRSYLCFYTHQMEKHKYIYLPHPPRVSNEFSCVHCNIEFMSKRAYDTHSLSYGHEEVKDITYTCIPCKKIFDDEDSMTTHVPVCKSNRGFPLPCRICGVQVTSGYDYYHHCRRLHPSCPARHGGKLCEQCGNILSVQKWSQHLCRKENSFRCAVCEKQFLTSRSYGLHMIYKHTEQPFHCALCPEKFKQRIKGKQHILEIHAPVLPYTCTVCHSQFSTTKYLNEHALSSHGIDTKEDLAQKNKKEQKRHIYIYPHMRLDVSGIDRKKLNELKFQVRDYDDTVIETINNDHDYSKYFIFDVKPDDNSEKKTRKKGKKSELTVETKKRKIETVVESAQNLDISGW